MGGQRANSIAALGGENAVFPVFLMGTHSNKKANGFSERKQEKKFLLLWPLVERYVILC
jgi:hypothetical protein